MSRDGRAISESYIIDADASASLHIASKKSASGEKLRSLHLDWIDAILLDGIVVGGEPVWKAT